MLLAFLGLRLWSEAPLPLALLVNLVILVVIPRFQRGQENLTHEASHQNWFRVARSDFEALKSWSPAVWAYLRRNASSINDVMANLLAAVPTFNTIASYWTNHKPHHHEFNSDVDPCRNRFTDFDRSDVPRFLLALIHGIGAYVSGWWLAFGLQPRTVALGLLWHIIVWIVPGSILLGWPSGLLVWLVYWVGPFVLVLPWLRFISESGKHKYGEESEFAATISNIGWIHRWYFNPHGDGYHVLHHWDPAIPHHQLRRAHEELVEAEPSAYGSRHRHRRRVLENPRREVAHTRTVQRKRSVDDEHVSLQH